MALGRISGPLLRDNLYRDGVDIAFETDLLYIDVINGRIGIKTATPLADLPGTVGLDVNGTTRTTDLIVDTQADIASFTLSSNVIASSNGTIRLEPSGTNPVVYQAKLVLDDLQISTNTIQVTTTDQNLVFETLGTGQVNINSNVTVNGDLHATGTITADGDITIGDVLGEDNVVFNADINSNIVPNVTNTYDLGTDLQKWRTVYTVDANIDNVISSSLVANGINLTLPQGQIYYVASNGSDAVSVSGTHEHDPFATIGRAIEVAESGSTIYVYPGVYEEAFPLEIPAGVTVKGASLRSVTVKPTASTRYLDVFHMNGEATVEDFTIMGFYHDPAGTYFEFPGDTNGTGHSVRFSFGTKTSTRSPYVRNFTVITFGTPSVLSINSIKTEVIGTLNRIKSLIPDIVQNNLVTGTTGNTEVQDTSLTASDATTGTALQDLIDIVVHVINNGTLRPDEPTLIANGSAVAAGMLYNAAAILEANRDWIVQEAYSYPTYTYSPTTFDETLTKRDMGLVLDALIYDILRGGNEHSYYAGFNFWVQPADDPRGYGRGDAGHGALVDGAVVDPTSREAAMLFHSVTFLTPAADTLIAKNGARVEWLNSFTYFAEKGLYATSTDLGFASQGKTRLRINNRSGTWAAGSTLKYYDTDGTTVLATGTIDSVEGNYVNLTGRIMSLVDPTVAGFETITDRTPTTLYAQGNAKLSTAQKKFGTASLALDGVGDYVTAVTQPDFDFNTGDFCLEAWVYNTSQPVANQVIFDFRTANPQVVPAFYINSTTNTLRYAVNGLAVIDSGSAFPLNTWTHIALARSGTSTKMFINGTKVGVTYTDTNNYIQGALTLGARFDGTTPFFGYIDDVRITKGVPRYTSNFTAPTSALVGDLSTVLLVHFNGTNNSTTFLDDGVTFQDLRVTNGGPTIGTASIIDFADYSDFGAEIRAIGSANIYGNHGAYGDGPGVIAYLISQNFAYVGAGKLTSNDPNDRISANEVVELHGARIYRTSVDNEGNFKVGNNFFINQKTGEVLFDNQSLTVTAVEGVTFTDGVNTTTLTPNDITTGNIQITGNTIQSLTGDVNVTAASGAINLKNNTYVTGNLDVTGDVTIGGNIQIGDQGTDTVSFVAGISSNLIPATTATYNLGTNLLRWDVAYLNRAEIDGLVIDSNTISTTLSNNNLTLQAAGTGKVYIPTSDVQINQNLTVGQTLTVTSGTTYLKNTSITGNITQTGDINQTGNFTTSGNLDVTGNITGTGYLQLPQVRIENNVISTTATNTDLSLVANGTGNIVFEDIKITNNNIQSISTNSNITLTPQGTGNVLINSTSNLKIPVGTTLERPATPAVGMIRYNTDMSRYEGWNGSYWLTLGGVSDADGNTYITAENTPGLNDNVIRFVVDGTLMSYLDATKLWADRLETNNLAIYDNTITTVATDTDINFTTSGAGSVKVGNFKIRNNTITNTVANAVTQFNQSGTGYVRIAGTNGVVIPAGDLSQLPASPEVGMIRFNTFYSIVEVYDGVTWVNVAGSSSGITATQAEEYSIIAALTIG